MTALGELSVQNENLLTPSHHNNILAKIVKAIPRREQLPFEGS